MKYFNRKAEKLWKEKVLAELPKIKVKGGQCRYNFRCHNNAIHDAVKNKDEKVAVVIYFDNGTILHFVNFHKNEYIDNTLGFWTEKHDYYFLRWIGKDQFNNDALDIFDSIRTQWKKLIPWWWRWLVDITI